jgi:acetyl-CoA acetyltransferase family protein
MSRAPYAVPKAEQAFSFGNLTAWDTALGWRFPNPRMQELHGTESMGETAENIFEMTRAISRGEQDAFAAESHRRAVAAIDSGLFAEEIVAVPVPQRKGDPVKVAVDERPRRDTTPETLARLKPAFRQGGTVTAGNSSGLNDGAAALVLTSDAYASRHGLKPMARIIASAAAGVPPRTMGLGPIPAVRKALRRAALELEDIRLIELNEAFAVQALGCIKELGVDLSKCNLNGSGISIGHPIGCTGARITYTLAMQMKKAGHKYGLASLCIGGGQGMAMVLEKA